MATVSIKIEGLDKLKGALLKSPQIVEDEVNRGIKRAVTSLQRTAKQLVPVKSGLLRSRHETDFSNMRGELYANTKYALWVHDGTKPHTIVPKSKKALFWKGASNPYKKVNHPGTQNMPWLTATAEQERSNIQNIMNDAVARALNRIFK